MKPLLVVALIQFLIVLFNAHWVYKHVKMKNPELHLSVRMGFSWSMVLVAFVLYVDSRQSYELLILIGMLFSAIGDVIMAKLLPLKERLYAGMLSFGLAHVLYSFAYLQFVQISIDTLLKVLGISFILIFILWRLIAFSPNRPFLFNLTSLFYGTVIVMMGIAATLLAITTSAIFLLPAIGAYLFILSDSLIALEEIQQKSYPYPALSIWITYVTAQLLIVYSGVFV